MKKATASLPWLFRLKARDAYFFFNASIVPRHFFDATAALVFLLELLRDATVDDETVVVVQLLIRFDVAKRVNEYAAVRSPRPRNSARTNG